MSLALWHRGLSLQQTVIVTKKKLGVPFLPRNLPIKFGTNPSTNFLVIVVTDRHTDKHTHKPTPVKTYTLAFASGVFDILALYKLE